MRPKELTVRGRILGAPITLIFTAANVYLGLCGSGERGEGAAREYAERARGEKRGPLEGLA